MFWKVDKVKELENLLKATQENYEDQVRDLRNQLASLNQDYNLVREAQRCVNDQNKFLHKELEIARNYHNILLQRLAEIIGACEQEED